MGWRKGYQWAGQSKGHRRAEGEPFQEGRSKKPDLCDVRLPHCGNRKQGRAQYVSFQQIRSLFNENCNRTRSCVCVRKLANAQAIHKRVARAPDRRIKIELRVMCELPVLAKITMLLTRFGTISTRMVFETSGVGLQKAIKRPKENRSN